MFKKFCVFGFALRKFKRFNKAKRRLYKLKTQNQELLMHYATLFTEFAVFYRALFWLFLVTEIGRIGILGFCSHFSFFFAAFGVGFLALFGFFHHVGMATD